MVLGGFGDLQLVAVVLSLGLLFCLNRFGVWLLSLFGCLLVIWLCVEFDCVVWPKGFCVVLIARFVLCYVF